jgi:hypothetical protein
VLTRCGIIVDLTWQDGKPSQATLKAQRDAVFKLVSEEREWPIELQKDQTYSWKPE